MRTPHDPYLFLVPPPGVLLVLQCLSSHHLPSPPCLTYPGLEDQEPTLWGWENLSSGSVTQAILRGTPCKCSEGRITSQLHPPLARQVLSSPEPLSPMAGWWGKQRNEGRERLSLLSRKASSRQRAVWCTLWNFGSQQGRAEAPWHSFSFCSHW